MRVTRHVCGASPTPGVSRFGLLFALAVAVAACGEEPPQVEDQVPASYPRFPSAAQPDGTQPWPEGSFTGECRHAPSGVEEYACFYTDRAGRRGFVCFRHVDELELETASGPYNERVFTDHHSTSLPAEGVC